MEESRVRLIDVTKKIGGRTIIAGLSFEVKPGEVFGLLGPNGAGKTTAIRMMVGLIALTAGEIRINGWSITKDFIKAIAQVGAIVENPEFYRYLSGYQNLWHYAKMYPQISAGRIAEVVKLVGLEDRITDPVKTYSLGMRQRLGVAQAILHRPSVLILDEPTNGLDPAGIRDLRRYLRSLAENAGVAVIVSSHLLTEMELMCDRVAVIKAGRLLDLRVIGGDLGTVKFLFQVDQPQQACQLVQLHRLATQVVQREEVVELITEREKIPEINARLVQSGIKVFGIQPGLKSLEDIFMEVTAGDLVGPQ